MAAPRLNIVRVDDYIGDAEGIDQESGTAAMDYYDEVELVDPTGEPCAMLAAPGWTDGDVRYEYINGGIGFSQRRSRHQLSIAVDYLDNETRSKLERWHRERALVAFNPGYGRYTEIAYRPLEGAGTTYADGTTTLKDLTGRWSLTSNGEADDNYVWDVWQKVMRGAFAGTNPRRVIPSRYGALQVMERAKTNVHQPASPESANPGHNDYGGASDYSGWHKAGTDASDITFTYDADGFGHDDCPGAINVQTDYAASADRQVSASAQWDSADDEHHYSFTGAGYATCSVWVRGRFGENSVLEFGQAGGNEDSITLADEDLSEWTKLSLAVYSADWTTGLPYLRFDLSTDTDDDSDNFWIGPCCVYHEESTAVARMPEWGDFGEAQAASYMSVSSFTFPSSGSMIASFYVPPGGPPTSHSMIGSSATAGRLTVASGTSVHWYRTSTNYLSGTVTFVEDAINTIAAVWDSGYDYRLYCNGELIDTATTSERELSIADASVTLYFGTGGGFVASPCHLHTARIDRKAYTTDEIAQLDAALRDEVANLVSVQARGRKYRIVQVPSAPRNQLGGTRWIGNLVLEEYEYDSNLADITTEEAM